MSVTKITIEQLQSAARINDADEACLGLQEMAGITDGGICGMFVDPRKWTGMRWDERVGLLEQWLEYELSLERM